jgi:hypothetical protein
MQSKNRIVVGLTANGLDFAFNPEAAAALALCLSSSSFDFCFRFSNFAAYLSLNLSWRNARTLRFFSQPNIRGEH